MALLLLRSSYLAAPSGPFKSAAKAAFFIWIGGSLHVWTWTHMPYIAGATFAPILQCKMQANRPLNHGKIMEFFLDLQQLLVQLQLALFLVELLIVTHSFAAYWVVFPWNEPLGPGGHMEWLSPHSR